ncbi:uncharacterized protein METZ01_LOCUS385975, partial [marine metagenome]
MVEVRGQLFGHFSGSHPDHHLQPRLPKPCDALTGDLGIRILDGHHDTGHPSDHDGFGARTGPSLVMTWLQRGHQRGPVDRSAVGRNGFDGHPFSVWATRWPSGTRADYAAID